MFFKHYSVLIITEHHKHHTRMRSIYLGFETSVPFAEDTYEYNLQHSLCWPHGFEVTYEFNTCASCDVCYKFANIITDSVVKNKNKISINLITTSLL
jgi:hypothetical protein